jgi:DNA recombination protein RmuC
MNETIASLPLGLLAATAIAGFILGWLIQFLISHNKLAKLASDLAVKDALIKSEETRIAEQETALSTVRESLMASFSELASDSLAKSNRAFLQLAEQNFAKHHTQSSATLKEREQSVENLVKPIREALEKTTQQIGEIEKSRKEAYGGITKQLEVMAQSHDVLRSETSKLVSSLRQPNVRGQWGELTLRRLAELAGMVDRCDFAEQVHVKSKDGDNSFRPDMIVHLPEDGQLVVDVKTPLESYLKAIEATDEKERKSHIENHARSMNQHIKTLASKAYFEQFERSPEFVILFVPGDQFLSAALDVRPSLLEDALRNKVLLVTPTSLVALLKVVAYGWMQFKLAENAEEIRDHALTLHTRLGTFTGHVANIGKKLESSVKSYNDAVASLESRVMPSMRRIADLGADSGKKADDPKPIDITTRELKLIAEDLTPGNKDAPVLPNTDQQATEQ